MSAAERHMLRVWWIRVLSIATGWDEDTLSVLANVMEDYRTSVRWVEASASWVAWLPDELKAAKVSGEWVVLDGDVL